MEKNKIKLAKVHEHMVVKGFKEPTCDIYDNKLNEKQLKEFLALSNENNNEEKSK